MERRLITPQQFVDQIRLWKGTRWHHQASERGNAADCIGLPKGAIRELGYDVSEVPTDYSNNAQPELLISFLEKSSLVQRATDNQLKIGRLVLFYVYKQPHHFGIITGQNTFIHSHTKYGVVETSLGKYSQRVHSVWVLTMVNENE